MLSPERPMVQLRERITGQVMMVDEAHVRAPDQRIRKFPQSDKGVSWKMGRWEVDK